MSATTNRSGSGSCRNGKSRSSPPWKTSRSAHSANDRMSSGPSTRRTAKAGWSRSHAAVVISRTSCSSARTEAMCHARMAGPAMAAVTGSLEATTIRRRLTSLAAVGPPSPAQRHHAVALPQAAAVDVEAHHLVPEVVTVHHGEVVQRAGDVVGPRDQPEPVELEGPPALALQPVGDVVGITGVGPSHVGAVEGVDGQPEHRALDAVGDVVVQPHRGGSAGGDPLHRLAVL